MLQIDVDSATVIPMRKASQPKYGLTARHRVKQCFNSERRGSGLGRI